MNEFSKLIENEIADFFAGFGAPGEPDIQSGEAQRQLTERLLSVLALRERAEPVAWMKRSIREAENWDSVDPEFVKSPEGWMSDYLPLYTAPPAPVVPDEMPETESEDGNDIDYMEPSAIYELGKTHGWNAYRAAMLAAPTHVATSEVTQDFKPVSRRKCMKCDQEVSGYTVNGLCEECYMYEQANPVLPECFERLLRHSHGIASGTDWNNGTAAKFHRDPLIQAVKDCRAMLKQHPLPAAPGKEG